MTRRRLLLLTSKAQALLETAVPPPIARALMSGVPARQLTRSFPSASVAFIALTAFERLVRELPPHALLRRLDGIWDTFDALLDQYDEAILKVETVAGCYVVAALPGLSAELPPREHVAALAQFCLDVLELCHEGIDGERVDVKIGINVGPVTAGVIGSSRQFFRLFGNTMNMASRCDRRCCCCCGC